MSKRQALGAITVNSNAGQFGRAGAAGTGGSAGFLKPVPSASVLKSSGFNNENEPPTGVKAHVSKQASSELEFDIFLEDRVAQTARNPPLGESNEPRDQRESKHVNFFLEAHCKTKTTEETNDEPEEEEEDDDQLDNDKENEDEEEEGISRLQIAAMMDLEVATATRSTKSSKTITSELNTSHCELMMDSSSSTHNSSVSSPMLLDDTIKFAASKSATSSLFIEDDLYEQDEFESLMPDENGTDLDDDEDEEVRQREAIKERDNVLMNFAEYKDEILEHMRTLELENRPKPSYMKKQVDITASMRSILVDWLVEVCEEYKLQAETLYLAVNYTDRFLSQMSVLRGKLQLVGTASMYVAAKYEEIIPPDISEFVYITDDTYNRKQVLRMEHLLLKTLEFKMSSPTINWFLSYFMRFIRQSSSLGQATMLGQRIENLARYLAELTLIDSETYLGFLPSQIAASAVYLAMLTLGRSWSKQVAEICGYSYDLSELKACIQALYKTMQEAGSQPQQAVQEKYKQKKYDFVAFIEAPKALPSYLAQ